VGEQPLWNPYGQHDPNQWQGQPYQGRPPYPQQSYRQQAPYQGQPYEPPYPQGQPYGQQPGPPSGHRGRPTRKSWPRRHKILTALSAVVALIIIGVIASNHSGSSSGSSEPPARDDSGQSAAVQILENNGWKPSLAHVSNSDPVDVTGLAISWPSAGNVEDVIVFDNTTAARAAYNSINANISYNNWNVITSLVDGGQTIVMEGAQADVADTLFSDW
jgi:hypothetical protein